MSGRPDLYVTTDTVAGVALVRGPEAKSVTGALCPDDRKFSRSGRGWVVPADVVGDLRAYAEHFKILLVVSERKAVS